MQANYGFYFEEAGLSRPHGATSADEEHFKGVSVEESLVRELGQNSLDASRDEGPVRIIVELAEMRTDEIPGIDELRKHINSAAESTRAIDKQNRRLEDSVKVLEREKLFVLRVGDYGTKGLAGNESRKVMNSPLVALTRGSGISAEKDGAGGSFGVGSSVGTLASGIHTVFWSTRATDKENTVLAGYSQLATHVIGDTWYQPDGFFTDLQDTTDFNYLRDPEAIGPFEKRTELGTDTYILGYSPGEDLELTAIRNAFIENFMVAIDRGNLVVEGASHRDGVLWRLDSKSLAKLVKEVNTAMPFYAALKDDDPYIREVPGLGELKLFIEFDDRFEKKYNTITVRKPLMKVASYSHNSIRAKYAAILDCSNDLANQELRKLETPRHDKWLEKNSSNGPATIRTIKNFIRDGLKSRMIQTVGEEVQIKGLNKFLPDGLSQESKEDFGGLQKPTVNGIGSKESATVHGQPDREERPEPKKQGSVSVAIQTSASQDGEMDVFDGKISGGDKTRNSKGGNLPGFGDKGDGTAKLLDGKVSMRSFSTGQPGETTMILRSASKVSGDLTLTALSAGGKEEDGFELPILGVWSIGTGGAENKLDVRGNTIKGVEIEGKNSKTTLKILFADGLRFRLGVK